MVNQEYNIFLNDDFIKRLKIVLTITQDAKQIAYFAQCYLEIKINEKTNNFKKIKECFGENGILK